MNKTELLTGMLKSGSITQSEFEVWDAKTNEEIMDVYVKWKTDLFDRIKSERKTSKDLILQYLKDELHSGKTYIEDIVNEMQEKGIVKRIVEIDHYGGENKGSEYWYVYDVEQPNGEKFQIKADGYYQSYNGTDWGDASVVEVEKAEEVVTVWKKAKQ